jgi:hypothetical protein
MGLERSCPFSKDKYNGMYFANHYHQKKKKTNWGKQALPYQACKEYNDLDYNTRSIEQLRTYQACKEYNDLDYNTRSIEQLRTLEMNFSNLYLYNTHTVYLKYNLLTLCNMYSIMYPIVS